MATLGTHAVLFGGFDSTADLSDTWLFNGSSWSPASTGPSDRESASMATLGNQVVLFGGILYASNAVLGDTWLFDGSVWTRPTIAHPPPARFGASMATIGSHVVMFGGLPCHMGCDAGAPLGDTWLFDGSTWSEAPSSAGGLNPPRAFAATATLGSQVIVFGGTAGLSYPHDSGPDLSDTWAFDGTTWSNLNIAAAPPARAAASMAAVGSELVLFGGHLLTSFYGDTWIFDGSAWTPNPSSSPPPRDRASMTGLP